MSNPVKNAINALLERIADLAPNVMSICDVVKLAEATNTLTQASLMCNFNGCQGEVVEEEQEDAGTPAAPTPDKPTRKPRGPNKAAETPPPAAPEPPAAPPEPEEDPALAEEKQSGPTYAEKIASAKNAYLQKSKVLGEADPAKLDAFKVAMKNLYTSYDLPGGGKAAAIKDIPETNIDEFLSKVVNF